MAAKNRTRTKIALGSALAVVMALLIAWCVFLVRDKLLLNADRMGTSLATTYAAEEENRFSIYRHFLGLEASYLHDMIERGDSEDEIAAWLEEFSINMTEVLGVDTIDPYAVIDESIVATNPWEDADTYDYAATAWYQNAVDNPGRMRYTDVYTDAASGDRMVTLSVAISNSGDVAAFDIRLDGMNAGRMRTQIPSGGSYFLFDRQGQLLYASTELDVNDAAVQEYLQNLIAGIESDHDETDSMSIAGSDGMNRSVYYSQMQNGWTSVVPIPTQAILQEGWDNTLLAIVAVFIAILLIAAAFMIRSALEERKARHTANTLRLLGDTFYAIYRIDYQRGTYEAIKSSADVRSELGEHGDAATTTTSSRS